MMPSKHGDVNEIRRGMYADATCVNTRYAKIKADKTVNNFVHFS